MRYLCGTATRGVHHGPNTYGDTQAVMYCDSDWAGEVDGCKLTTGYCFYLLGQRAINWKKKKNQR